MSDTTTRFDAELDTSYVGDRVSTVLAMACFSIPLVAAFLGAALF